MDEGYDLVNLERARALLAGESLAPLPPEAFQLKPRSAAQAPADDDVDPRATAGGGAVAAGSRCRVGRCRAPTHAPAYAAMSRFDRLALTASIAVAAFLRLPGIEARGRFDADQGHDMLTLLAFTRDGVVPLLGPKTSVGEFHHGAFYYFLLAPSAACRMRIRWWSPSSWPCWGSARSRSRGGSGARSAARWPGPSRGCSSRSLPLRSRNRPSSGTRTRSGSSRRSRSRPRGERVRAAGPGGGPSRSSPRGWSSSSTSWVRLLRRDAGDRALQARRDRSVLRPLGVGVALVALLFLPLIAYELHTGFAETRGVLAYFAEAGGARAPTRSSRSPSRSSASSVGRSSAPCWTRRCGGRASCWR